MNEILRESIPSSNGAPEPAPNPWAAASLRLSQDFDATLLVKKQLLTVPVRKPSKEWFVRVHPDESYRMQTYVLELKEDRETYLVHKSLWNDLATGEATFSTRIIYTAINRQGVVFLWPIRLPDMDGKTNDWNQSAIEAAQLATRKWVRITANMSLGAYEVFEATGELPEPKWPELSLDDLLDVAFKRRRIDTLDHPVLLRLRGES